MGRKILTANEASPALSALSTSASSMMRKRLMNDIMYYLRRLLKIARSAQMLSLREGVESAEMNQLYEELNSLRDEISELCNQGGS